MTRREAEDDGPIGSEFEAGAAPMTRTPARQLPLLHRRGTKKILLASGSDALTYIFRSLTEDGPRTVVFPSYLCEEMLAPARRLGLPCRFYRVDGRLRVDFTSLEAAMKPGSIVIIIHYFGFPLEGLDRITQLCRESGSFLVEDCVQAPFTVQHGKPLGAAGSFSFTSYRKVLPVPDGALLCVNGETPAVAVQESAAHRRYVAARWDAMLRKRSYLARPGNVPERFFKESFVAAERLRPRSSAPLPISRRSREILETIDVTRVIALRRKNYQELWRMLSRQQGITPLFPLTAGVCPSGFPVVCKERDRVRRTLMARRIYPPVHWELPKRFSRFKESSWLSRHILTLPIDQRYTPKEMRRIAEAVRHA